MHDADATFANKTNSLTDIRRQKLSYPEWFDGMTASMAVLLAGFRSHSS